MFLITEWNQKCNEKLQIPFSTTPWFYVLVGITVSWQPLGIICGGQWVHEGCEEWCPFGLTTDLCIGK